MLVQVGDHAPEHFAPSTPKEKLQQKVEYALIDAYLATAELVKLRTNPDAQQFFDSRAEGDLWSIKTRVDLLVSELRAAGERRSA